MYAYTYTSMTLYMFVGSPRSAPGGRQPRTAAAGPFIVVSTNKYKYSSRL